jgi:hypothetical protein
MAGIRSQEPPGRATLAAVVVSLLIISACSSPEPPVPQLAKDQVLNLAWASSVPFFSLCYYPIFWAAHLVGDLPPGRDHVHQVVLIVLSLFGLVLSIREFFPRDGRRLKPN